MSNTWLYADPHFYQPNITKFLREDGTKLRPWDDSDEMSEWMIDAYNDLVGDKDRVYVLGDVAISRKALRRSLPRLKGRKVLVKGNHDTDKLSYYSQFFEDIRAYVVKKDVIMSHIPIHPESLSRWKVNIHGHLHSRQVMLGPDTLDPRYVCVSVEHTEFKPVLLDEVLSLCDINRGS